MGVNFSRWLLSLLYLTSVPVFAQASQDATEKMNLNPHVTIAQGTLDGVQSASVLSFKGIPYAQPPVGKLRWAPPQPLAPSMQMQPAKTYGASCPQRNKKATREDCLYLNVFSPIAHTTAALPVLVWIHGGGYVGGSGNLSDDAIRHLVGQNMLLVSFNYRLGALGIFAPEQLKTPSGNNFALMDMVAALKWVQQNIAAFGGDPNRVTIAGGSAGGMAVQLLMATPDSNGLFQRAISQSGYGAWPLPRTSNVTTLAGSPSANAIADGIIHRASQTSQTATDARALYALNASDLVNAVSGFHLPIVDGITLPEEPAVMFLRGQQHPVAYISGGNSYDGSVYPYSGVPAAKLTDLVADLVPNVSQTYQLQQPGFDSLSYQHLFGDLRYLLAGAITSGAMQTAHTPGYRYFFAHSNDARGAHHGAEVDALFHPANSQAIAMMQGYWRHFIESGNPNSEDLPEWQPVNSQQQNWLVIDNSIHAEPQIRPQKLTLLKQAYLHRVSSLLGN